MNASPKILQLHNALDTLAMAIRLVASGHLRVGSNQFDAWESEVKSTATAAFHEANEILTARQGTELDIASRTIEQCRLHLTETFGFPVELTPTGVTAWVEGLGEVPLDEVVGERTTSEPMLPLSKVIAIIESEPVLPGDMPRGVWFATWKFIVRKGLVTLLRRTVRVTKTCIVKRVRASVGR